MLKINKYLWFWWSKHWSFGVVDSYVSSAKHVKIGWLRMTVG